MSLLGGWQIIESTEGDTAEPSTFIVATKNSDGEPLVLEKNPFTIKVYGPDNKPCDTKVEDLKNGTFKVTYQATQVGEHGMKVTTRMGLPKAKQGTDSSKTLVYGPGVEDGKVQDNLPTHFTIESRDRDGNKVPRGGDPYEVNIQGPNGPVESKITDNNDGTYTVEYAPSDAGKHKIDVTLKEKAVAKSPYHVNVKEGADHRTSCIGGIVFTIQSKTKSGKNLDRGGEPFSADSDLPEFAWKDNGNGTYTASAGTIAAGATHTLDVKVNDNSIVGCPATFNF